MPVPTLITDLSTSAGSNSPSGSETPIEGDNHLRAAYSFIAQLRDQQTTVTNQLNGTATGVVLKSASTNTSFTIGAAAGDALTINSQSASIPNGLNLTGGNVYVGTKTTIYDLANRTHVTANGVSTAAFGLAIGGAAKGAFVTDGTNNSITSPGVLNIVSNTNSVCAIAQTSGILTDANGVEYGFRGAPQNLQTSNYTLVAADRGKHVMVNSPATQVTIPNGVFSTGDVVMIVNNTGGNLTIVQGSGFSLRQSGTSNTGNRTSLVNGVSQLVVVAAGFGNIHGAGLT